jgi:hypothetical protein
MSMCVCVDVKWFDGRSQCCEVLYEEEYREGEKQQTSPADFLSHLLRRLTCVSHQCYDNFITVLQ